MSNLKKLEFNITRYIYKDRQDIKFIGDYEIVSIDFESYPIKFNHRNLLNALLGTLQLLNEFSLKKNGEKYNFGDLIFKNIIIKHKSYGKETTTDK